MGSPLAEKTWPLRLDVVETGEVPADDEGDGKREECDEADEADEGECSRDEWREECEECELGEGEPGIGYSRMFSVWLRVASSVLGLFGSCELK